MSESDSSDGSTFDPWDYLMGGDGDPDTEDDSLSGFDESTLDVLQTFGSSPVGFIFGVILTPILNGIEGIAITGLELFNLVIFGDARGSAAGMIGIADIPRVSAGLLIDAGNLIRGPVIEMAIDPLANGLVDVARWSGPWGLLGAVIALAVLANLYAGTLRKALEIVLDLIPGGGAILE